MIKDHDEAEETEVGDGMTFDMSRLLATLNRLHAHRLATIQFKASKSSTLTTPSADDASSPDRSAELTYEADYDFIWNTWWKAHSAAAAAAAKTSKKLKKRQRHDKKESALLPGSEDEFLYFIRERHRINLERHLHHYDDERGCRRYTDDPILATYRFTNVFRELDRVTLWMRQNIAPSSPSSSSPWLYVFNATWYRLFGTIAFAERLGGWQPTFDADRLRATARQMRMEKVSIFTAAYIVPAMSPGAGIDKAASIIDKLQFMFDTKQFHAIAETAERTHSLAATFEQFSKVKYIGSNFLAYEIVSDLRWMMTHITFIDVNTWANAGPGARRGLERVYQKNKKCTL
eukprot:PhM_4_TR17322/c0_g1_i1/m.106576